MGRCEARGPPRAVRRNCLEEPVRTPPAPGPPRREHSRSLRGRGRRVHHGFGRGTRVCLRRRCGPSAVHPHAGVRRRVDQPRRGDPCRPCVAAARRPLRGEVVPRGGKDVRASNAARGYPSVHKPGPGPRAWRRRASRPSRSERESLPPRYRNPRRGAPEPRLRVPGNLAWTRWAPARKPGPRPRGRQGSRRHGRGLDGDEARLPDRCRLGARRTARRAAPSVGRPSEGPRLAAQRSARGARENYPGGRGVPRDALVLVRPGRPGGPERPRVRTGHRTLGRGSRTARVPYRVAVRSLAGAVVGADAWPDLLGPFAFVQEAPAFLPGRRQAAEDAAAVRGIADPVDLRIAPDRGMVRIDKDDLVVLVRPILPDPVRVEDLHVRIVLGGPLLRDTLNRLRHRDLDEPAAFRVASAHRAGPSPAPSADPCADDDISLLCTVSQFTRAIDAGRPFHADEGVAAAPFDHPLKMGLLDHAAPRILPRLFDERVQVPRTSGRLRLPFRGNAQLRFRSLWGFVGHGPTPWIYGFARRYISRPGSSKAPCQWGETIKPFPPRGGPLSGDARPGSL